jgi:serine/threonine-protein kinase RsbT
VAEEIRIPIRSDADVVTARQEGKVLAAELDFSATEVTLIATAISEVARNILTYAVEGEICLTIVSQGERRRGVHVVAADDGPGIEDLDSAMQDGYSTGQGMGLGLPGARRLMDAFDVRSSPGEGTTVTMTKWEARSG